MRVRETRRHSSGFVVGLRDGHQPHPPPFRLRFLGGAGGGAGLPRLRWEDGRADEGDGLENGLSGAPLRLLRRLTGFRKAAHQPALKGLKDLARSLRELPPNATRRVLGLPLEFVGSLDHPLGSRQQLERHNLWVHHTASKEFKRPDPVSVITAVRRAVDGPDPTVLSRADFGQSLLLGKRPPRTPVMRTTSGTAHGFDSWAVDLSERSPSRRYGLSSFARLSRWLCSERRWPSERSSTTAPSLHA